MSTLRGVCNALSLKLLRTTETLLLFKFHIQSRVIYIDYIPPLESTSAILFWFCQAALFLLHLEHVKL